MMIVFAKLLICIILAKIYIRYFSNFPKKSCGLTMCRGFCFFRQGRGNIPTRKPKKKFFSPRGYFFVKVG